LSDLATRREELRAKAIELGVDDQVGDQPGLLLAIGAYAHALDVPEFLAFNLNVTVEELFEAAEEMRAEGIAINPD
jgi:hypothetical protein